MLRSAQAKADAAGDIDWLVSVGRPPAFDREGYKRRNVVERCFNRLKQGRGIATRYDKTSESYEAAVTLASLLMRV